MSALEEAKERLPLPELMAKIGLRDYAKKSARCPLHEDRNNSFSVYEDSQGDWRWKCFAGCGGGDEIDFLARWEKIDNAGACRRLIELTGARSTGTENRQREQYHGPTKPIPERVPVMPGFVADAWREGVDYLLAHPVNAERLAAFRGWPVSFAQYIIDCAAISLPLHYNERGIAFQVVAPEGDRRTMTTRPIGYHIRLKGKPGEKATWRFQPSEKGHGQGIPALPYLIGDFDQARLLVITEGQWDALTFAFAAGWLGEGCLWPKAVGVVGIRGAQGVNPFLGYYERFWPASANCLLLADADKAGGSWSEGEGCFAKQLAKRCAKVAVVDCYPHKDFNDLYRAVKPGKDEISDLLANHGMAVESGGSVSHVATGGSLFREVLTLEQPLSDLGQILQDICDYLNRFMAFSSDAQPIAIALWVAHTWTIDAFDYTPYLHILSPEKRCGKSRLLDCLALLVGRPWQVVSPSEAVLFRKIEADSPTLLLDEVDTIFCRGKDDGKEPLRALLNAGFERRAKIPRCVGPRNELQEFAVFSAKALAGIGKLPDTVSDRCIPIRLVRRAQNEKVERFRRREADAIASTIRDALAQWSESNETRATLREARPEVPDQLGDRQTDICEPLLAIADLAGDGWPTRARDALVELCAGEIEEDDSLGVKLLRTIRTIFGENGTNKMPSRELLDALVASDDDGPWAGWWERDLADDNTRGPAAKLARLLKPYGIKARVIRLDDASTPRGYRIEDFEEAWNRYCPPKPA